MSTCFLWKTILNYIEHWCKKLYGTLEFIMKYYRALHFLPQSRWSCRPLHLKRLQRYRGFIVRKSTLPSDTNFRSGEVAVTSDDVTEI